MCRGVVWYGMAWHGMAWHGMAWYGKVGNCTSTYSPPTSSLTDIERYRSRQEPYLGPLCFIYFLQSPPIPSDMTGAQSWVFVYQKHQGMVGLGLEALAYWGVIAP